MSADLLGQARAALADARAILEAGVPAVAAREAYIAMLHADQAVLRERAGSVPRTHAGVHGQFGRLAKNEPGLGSALGVLLVSHYEDKQAADYGDRRLIDRARAEQALADAGRLLAAAERLLAAPDPPAGGGSG